MSYPSIEKKIEAALADERKHNRLANHVAQTAKAMGVSFTGEHLAEVIRFVTDYVQEVPLIMKAAQQAAGRAGVTGEMNNLIGIAVQYWDEPNDVIPDRLGLQGVCDDAYFTMCVLQTASAIYQMSTGRALLGQDLTKVNMDMRGLIGEPAASQLDQLVLQAIGMPTFDPMIQALAANPGFSSYTPMTNHDIDCRLAQMGFFWD